MRTNTYQPFGRVPALTGLAFICSCGLAVQWALVYTLLILGKWWSWSPVFALAFAFCLALIVRAACVLAKVRNPGLMRQFGLIVGLFAWLAHWIFWIVIACYDNARSMPGQSMAIPIADLFAGGATHSIEALPARWRQPDGQIPGTIGFYAEFYG